MQSKLTKELVELDWTYVWHPFAHMKQWLAEEPLVIVAAEGMELIDSEGKRYLDGVSSLWCNVHGHRVPEIDAAVKAQLDRVAHSTMLGLANEPAARLAERLMRIVPAGLAKVFYSDAGATATEIAFKLAVQYWHNIGKPAKTQFVGLAEAYHGDTTGAMSVGRTEAFHKPYFPLLFKVHYAPTPFAYRWGGSDEATERRSDEGGGRTESIECATAPNPPLPMYTWGEGRGEGLSARGPSTGEPPSAARTAPHPSALPGVPGRGEKKAPEGVAGRGDQSAEDGVRDACLAAMEAMLAEHHGTIAAVCVEPVVQGAAGMIVQPAGYLRGVRELCDKYDVLLICDEVATGFGRTGKMFACEHEDVRPDLMCAAKGITGGYLPLAATFATQKIFDAFLGEPWEGKTFFHGHTYTGNPLACAAALASLDLFERNGLLAQVQQNAKALAVMLDELRGLPHVGDIRQKGLMVGIELVAERGTKRPFDSRRRMGAAVCAAVRKHGVIIRPLGDTIVLMPPLAMSVTDLRRIVDAVKAEVSRLVR